MFTWQDHIVYMTKIIDEEFDHAEFVSGLLDNINTRAFVVIDYHGFVENDGEPQFVYGSRNTAVISNSNRSGFIVKSKEDREALVTFF